MQMFAQSSRKKCHDNTQYQTQLSEQAEEWRKPDREQLTILNLQPGTSCRNTLKSYASHPFSWHDIGMCAQETQNHTCRKKIMLKHSKASLQCRCFFWVKLFETSTSPLANPGHLTITCSRGVGNLTITWVGWGIWTRSVKLTSFRWCGSNNVV